jgi:hypothetical protein
MELPHDLSTPARAERARMSPAALDGAARALLVTALIGATALALELAWPWLAWGYVLLAFALGCALATLATRVQRVHEREVDRLRQEYRAPDSHETIDSAESRI